MTKQWEQYEATIRALYADHTLSTVRQIMIEQHGFKASVRAYRGRLDRWKVRKYNRRNRHSSVSSGSGSDDAASRPATSRDKSKAGSALARNDVQNGWTQRDAAALNHNGTSISAAASQPPPYPPSQYIQRRHSQNTSNEGHAQPQPSPSLHSPGYQTTCYWAHAQGPQHSSLGSQVSAVAVTTAAGIVPSIPAPISPYYAIYASVAHPVSSWSPGSGALYATTTQAETGVHYGSFVQHDQRIGSPGHLKMPFGPGVVPDGRHHGAGEDAQGYDVTPQNPSDGGGHRH